MIKEILLPFFPIDIFNGRMTNLSQSSEDEKLQSKFSIFQRDHQIYGIMIYKVWLFTTCCLRLPAATLVAYSRRSGVVYGLSLSVHRLSIEFCTDKTR